MDCSGWIAGIVLLLGASLTWLGLRGRRVDDHPVCRKCGRDLFGVNYEGRACPECGTKLTTDGIRTGNRDRRSGLLGVGITLLTLAALSLAPAAMTLVLGARAERAKPLWLLMWESRTSASTVQEISRREAANELDPADVDRVAARWLDEQGDQELPWLFEKGDLLFHLANSGKLTPAQQQRLFEQAVVPTLEVRGRVRSGSVLPIWESGETRGAAGRVNVSQMQSSEVPVNLVLIRDGQSFATMYTSASVIPGMTIHHTLELPHLPPGEYGLAIEPAVVRPPRRPAAPTTRPAPGLQPLFTVTVVPADEPTVEVVEDAEVLARVQRGLGLETLHTDKRSGKRVPAIWVTYRGGWNEGPDGVSPHSYSLTYGMSRLLDDGPLPYALAYEAFFRDEQGREWPAGEHRLRAGASGPGAHGYGGDLPPEFDAEVVDVILRPSISVAEETPHATTILGGEVVIEDVEVVWQDRPASPTTAPDDGGGRRTS